MTTDELFKSLGYAGSGGLLMLIVTKAIPKLLNYIKNSLTMGNRVERLESKLENINEDIRKILDKLNISQERLNLYSDTNKARVLQTQFNLLDKIFDGFIALFESKAPEDKADFIIDFREIVSEYYRSYEVTHALEGNSGFIELINECMNFAIKDVFDKYNEDHVRMMTTWRKSQLKLFEKECNRWRSEFKNIFALFFERFFNIKKRA